MVNVITIKKKNRVTTWNKNYYQKDKEAKKLERIKAAKAILKDYKEWNIHELDVVDVPQVQFKVKEMVN